MILVVNGCKVGEVIILRRTFAQSLNKSSNSERVNS